ncbi:hypothetical protein Poly24_01050 [Rosistilla carotiformis]|uniref:Uncharacterized protein n=1 Tax=Rosistilla carotiformis TaxID=2528017 RepID=A0A518JLJ4_9BACT|nr:hypothetical protein Poly24_01050 [Rosistilla carotiformis]
MARHPQQSVGACACNLGWFALRYEMVFARRGGDLIGGLHLK